MNDSKVSKSGAKPPLAMTPLRLLIPLARVWYGGAIKHGRGNWANVDITDNDAGARYLDAALRHLAEIQEEGGQVTTASLAHRDADSALPSLDHAIASLLILRNIAIRSGALPLDPGAGNVVAPPPEVVIKEELEKQGLEYTPGPEPVYTGDPGEKPAVYGGAGTWPVHRPEEKPPVYPWPETWVDVAAGMRFLHPGGKIHRAVYGVKTPGELFRGTRYGYMLAPHDDPTKTLASTRRLKYTGAGGKLYLFAEEDLNA